MTENTQSKHFLEKHPSALLAAALLVVLLATLAFMPLKHQNATAPEPATEAPAGPCLLAGSDAEGLVTYSGEIRNGSPFRGALLDAGIPGCAADTIQRYLQASGFDFGMCKPGQQFTVQVDTSGAVKAFCYAVDRLKSYWIVPDSSGALFTQIWNTPTTRELVSVEGTIESSVWNAMQTLGETAELVVAYEEVLGYDMDFIFDPRKGDSFHVLVERIKLGDEIVGYGNIIAAEYKGEVVGSVKGYWFSGDSGKMRGWFAPSGENMQKAFKRAPLPFLKVTSAFGMRRHPISGKHKMHTGIDYGAPAGTPVWAIGAGKVVTAGYHGGYGKMVEIQHTGSIKTRYAHLSVIAVRRGQSVAQHQTIGKVGSTGYSTGPHLHFEFLVNGRFTPPRSVKNPSLKKLPESLMPAFRAEMLRADSLWQSVKSKTSGKTIAQR